MMDIVKTGKIGVILVASVAAAALFILHDVTRGPIPVNVLLISVDTLRPDHLGCYG